MVLRFCVPLLDKIAGGAYSAFKGAHEQRNFGSRRVNDTDVVPTRILLSEHQIRTRVHELAKQIERDYQGRSLVIVGILRGGLIFLADLVRQIRLPLRIELLRASSYGASTVSGGEVELGQTDQIIVRGEHVLILDDILDTGNTLTRIKGWVAALSPASVKTCVLLDKPARRQVSIEADYTGFVIDNHFVVGYGLDYRDKWRNLPYVAIAPEAP